MTVFRAARAVAVVTFTTVLGCAHGCTSFGSADPAADGGAPGEAGGGPVDATIGDGAMPDVLDQTDSGPPCVPGAPGCIRYVFVTTATTDGRLATGPLSPLAAADAKCAFAAVNGGVPAVKARASRFKAWLSTDSQDAIVRLKPDSRPVRTPDGAVVVSGGQLLILLQPIHVTEAGGTVPAPLAVWTGTLGTDGTAASAHCSSWTLNGGSVNGAIGDPNATNAAWTNAGVQTCDMQAHLYCLEE